MNLGGYLRIRAIGLGSSGGPGERMSGRERAAGPPVALRGPGVARGTTRDRGDSSSRSRMTYSSIFCLKVKKGIFCVIPTVYSRFQDTNLSRRLLCVLIVLGKSPKFDLNFLKSPKFDRRRRQDPADQILPMGEYHPDPVRERLRRTVSVPRCDTQRCHRICCVSG